MDCPCGKYLTAMLPMWLPLLAAVRRLDKDREAFIRLCHIMSKCVASFAQIKVMMAGKLDGADPLDADVVVIGAGPSGLMSVNPHPRPVRRTRSRHQLLVFVDRKGRDLARIAPPMVDFGW